MARQHNKKRLCQASLPSFMFRKKSLSVLKIALKSFISEFWWKEELITREIYLILLVWTSRVNTTLSIKDALVSTYIFRTHLTPAHENIIRVFWFYDHSGVKDFKWKKFPNNDRLEAWIIFRRTNVGDTKEVNKQSTHLFCLLGPWVS